MVSKVRIGGNHERKPFALGCVELGYRIAGYQVSVGTVVLIALLLISGSQFTLFAMWFDMESNKDLR